MRRTRSHVEVVFSEVAAPSLFKGRSPSARLESVQLRTLCSFPRRSSAAPRTRMHAHARDSHMCATHGAHTRTGCTHAQTRTCAHTLTRVCKCAHTQTLPPFRRTRIHTWRPNPCENEEFPVSGRAVNLALTLPKCKPQFGEQSEEMFGKPPGFLSISPSER